MQPGAGHAFVDVHQFVLADDHDVAVIEVVAPHALALHENTVGAVEILDQAAIGTRDDLAVVPAHEAAVDLQIVVAGAAHDDAAHRQRQLPDGAAFGRDDDAADGVAARSDGGGVRGCGALAAAAAAPS